MPAGSSTPTTPPPVARPARASAAAGPRRRPPPAARARSGDWPRTGRALPWTLAAFLTLLWLTPFHAITLTASLPFDLSLDRIVLPFVIALWALLIAAGGQDAPRLRLTPVHVGVGALVAVALLSVVVNAGGLNETLLLDDAMKRVVLLVSFAMLFLMLASTVRPREVWPFLVFTLVLAVVASAGVLYEFRFHSNLFYRWADGLLPGSFRVRLVDTSGVDENGRRLVVGPAQVGLETVAMLAMALPIAIVGAMHTGHRGRRWLYVLAMCVIVAAAFSTYRKSALIAPVAVGLTLAWFRPRDTLRLAPFAVVLAVVVHGLAPGAIGGVLQQLDGSHRQVNTTSHRVAGYDAVRPLVWSNLALGQGYGSYDANANHILDSQILTAAVETGVAGVAAYLFMLLSVVATARPVIRGPDRERARIALVAAAAALALVTVSFLYDAMIFPHVPYIFLTIAALMAVAWRPAQERAR